jgi:hypothetical protein
MAAHWPKWLGSSLTSVPRSFPVTPCEIHGAQCSRGTGFPPCDESFPSPYHSTITLRCSMLIGRTCGRTLQWSFGYRRVFDRHVNPQCGYNTYRGWTQTEYQNKHYNINQGDEESRPTEEEMEGPTSFFLCDNFSCVYCC